MSKPVIRIYADLQELSQAAAARFAEKAKECAAARRIMSAAVSGGETPKVFFRSLSRPEVAGQIPWDSVHLFQVDERAVPPDHAESNYRMIREELLDRVPQARKNFHRMEAERPDLEAAALEYEGEIAAALHADAGGLPRFDLIFLGMGPDGHTASLFPESPVLDERTRWVCANFVAKLASSRLTLTFPLLNAAAEILFLVSGLAKAGTLKQVLEGPHRPEHFPSQGIQPIGGKAFWYIDEAAAALLRQVETRGA